MDNLLKAEAWPIWLMLGVTFNAAIVNLRKLTIPNVITLPMILGGWLLGMAHMVGLYVADAGKGNMLAALAGTGLALLLLGVLWQMGMLGAGSVKLQMGIGSWLGAYYGMGPGISATLWASVIAVVLFGIQTLLIRKSDVNLQPTAPAQLIGLIAGVVGMELHFLPILLNG